MRRSPLAWSARARACSRISPWHVLPNRGRRISRRGRRGYSTRRVVSRLIWVRFSFSLAAPSRRTEIRIERSYGEQRGGELRKIGCRTADVGGLLKRVSEAQKGGF